MAFRPEADKDLLVLARAKGHARSRQFFSPGVVVVAGMLSMLHLLNFLNYTQIGGYFNPPLTRSALLICFALFILLRHAGNLRFHFSRSWDMYALCAIALLSASYSDDPSRTLKYGAWLLLSVYVGTELAARIRQPNDILAALCIVLLPASVFVAAVNVMLGPVVMPSGREFGALGSHHVDTALAMDFICFFLALRAIPVRTVTLPKWLNWVMWGVLLWAGHRALFGLTRSVWLGVTLTLSLFIFRRSLNLRSFLGVLFFAALAVMAIDYIGIDSILPDAVKGRVEVSEQRIEAGQIDPRLERIREAYREAIEKPFGTGYATSSWHNSYMNILLNFGWFGFGLAMLAIARSVIFVWRAGFHWLLFFSIGSAALLLHAFFEVQNWPGQGNFVPLLLWYALSRSRFHEQPVRNVPARSRVVDA